MDLVSDRNEQALTRILIALAAMAGLLDAAWLPRDIHRAILGPFRAAEAAARRLERSGSTGQLVPDVIADSAAREPTEATRLRRRFAALSRRLDRLARSVLEGSIRRRSPRPDPGSPRKARDAHEILKDLHFLAREALDTS